LDANLTSQIPPKHKPSENGGLVVIVTGPQLISAIDAPGPVFPGGDAGAGSVPKNPKQGFGAPKPQGSPKKFDPKEETYFLPVGAIPVEGKVAGLGTFPAQKPGSNPTVTDPVRFTGFGIHCADSMPLADNVKNNMYTRDILLFNLLKHSFMRT